VPTDSPHGATLDDLDPAKVERFLRIAQRERNFVLGPGTPIRDVLTHLNLLDGERPSHAAILLFGKAPQRHIGLLSSEVKCVHYPTTAGGKPMLDYKIFKGSVFELVDQAVHFVMDKLAHAVGTRSESVAAPITPEIPREVVTEAIVNAVAHRDYASAASVQVELFPDRLEEDRSHGPIAFGCATGSLPKTLQRMERTRWRPFAAHRWPCHTGSARDGR
jgi:ATP-dependent DNA helicase RecG